MSQSLQMRITAQDVRNILVKNYTEPEYALFFEVPSGTGGPASRYADALVVNLWPSRGLELWGMEIKVSRSDWLSELKKPAKAESIMQYCDRWYLVVGSSDIVKDGELPVNWGLMVIKKNRLVIEVPAPKLTPSNISRSFFASLCRTVKSGMIHHSQINERVQDEVNKKIQINKSLIDYRYERLKDSYYELLEQVELFEKASGISIRSTFLPGEKIGKAVMVLLDYGPVHTRRILQDMCNRLDAISKQMQEGIL